ncbi:MAG: DUF4058 family protein [Chloroflexi bacterium]|nr:DUF4058 family protein [Chloroflexota bacterium]
MPSPFPGMDPYLENPALWPDIHSSLIAYIREELQPQVRPKYIARIGERVELTDLGRAYIPDVLVVHPPLSTFGGPVAAGVLVADEPVTIEMLEEERRVPFIEIISREFGDVVTLIEVLSPANKTGAGREQYLHKQRDILYSQVNLVEIDLLGDGRATTLARNAPIAETPYWRYIVSISRGALRGRLEAYPISLRDRLPRCRIPLRPEDEDAVLDLPAVFTRCYDVGGYDLLIDYTQPPPVSLSPADEEWIAALLAAQRNGVKIRENPFHP